MDRGFELHLVRPGIPSKALKSGAFVMARSKTLLLEISDDCRDVHVQTEQDNSDITHSRYSVFHWDRSPQDVIDWMEAALKSDPVSALGPMGPIKRGVRIPMFELTARLLALPYPLRPE